MSGLNRVAAQQQRRGERAVDWDDLEAGSGGDVTEPANGAVERPDLATGRCRVVWPVSGATAARHRVRLESGRGGGGCAAAVT